ncbi:hypothetical protein NQ317_015654 [Molorchus minor]|uniref:Uncharacterized protein n=1 Tax=Molorchus minor TaxID=1323400 RepID=A0ABQ9JKH9_9CUCU|nr:hypothetical protein NQ317_015654 [Molorchus minor]
MESDYHWLITIGLVISSVLAVTVNFFLLVIFCRRRGLRTIPNRFVNNLITNLLSSILLIPPPRRPGLHPQWSLLQNHLGRNPGRHQRGDPHRQRGDNRDQREHPERTPIAERNGPSLPVLLRPEHHEFRMHRLHLQHPPHRHQPILRSHPLVEVPTYITRCRSTVFIAISWCVAPCCAILSSLTFTDSSLWHLRGQDPNPVHGQNFEHCIRGPVIFSS